MFQAIEYLWGKSSRLSRPPFVRRLAFASPSDRDEWVRNGSPFVNGPGYRESIDVLAAHAPDQPPAPASAIVRPDCLKHPLDTCGAG